MKKITFLLTLFLTGIFSLQAQNEGNLIRELFNQEKKAVVDNFLNLSDADAAKFWPIYQAYEAERRAISDSRIQLLKDYANQYSTLTDDQADKLMTAALKNVQNTDKLKAKYYKKAKKALSARQATSWIQLEDYIQTAVRMDLLDNIPFVGEN